MASPPATKKRKLDNLSADTGGKSDTSILLDDDDVSPAQRLPPPLWGSIMDFMHYSDVRSTIAVCRSIATEAAANVKCISVHHSEEMKIPPARRFTHVEEVNLLSVVVHGERQRISFSAAAASQIVPFLTAFPMLKKCFVGGRRRIFTPFHMGSRRREYSITVINDGPDNHVELFRGIVTAFAGAFRSRLLSNALDLYGVVAGVHLGPIRDLCRDRTSEDPDHPCDFCRGICHHFPLRDVLDADVCLHDTVKFGILRDRPGGEDCIRRATPRMICRYLRNEVKFKPVNRESDAGKELLARLSGMGVVQAIPGAQFISNDAFRLLDDMVEIGFHPRYISKAYLYREFGISNPQSRRGYDVWISSSFHKLVERGFALDAKDVILLDEAREPGLVDWLPPPGVGQNDNDDDNDDDDDDDDDDGGNDDNGGNGGGDNEDDMED